MNHETEIQDTAANGDTWSVLKTTFHPLDLNVSAGILNRCCQVPLSEATVRVRACRGIIVRMAPREQAEAVAREFTAAGVPAIAAPDSMTPRPPRPYPIRQARATNEALFAPQGYTGGEAAFPWAQTLVIAAGQVVETESKLVSTAREPRASILSTTVFLTTGIPVLAGGGAGVKAVYTRGQHRYLDILGGEPLVHYRLDAGMFNYASLIPQPSPVAEANFCYAVRGFVQMAPEAATNMVPPALLRMAAWRWMCSATPTILTTWSPGSWR